MKRKVTRRSKEQWSEIINLWKNSNKTKKAWCFENSIPYTSFLQAYNRAGDDKIFKRQKSEFIEIIDEIKTGLELSYKLLKLNLLPNFDEATLIRFLKLLEKLDASNIS